MELIDSQNNNIDVSHNDYVPIAILDTFQMGNFVRESLLDELPPDYKYRNLVNCTNNENGPIYKSEPGIDLSIASLAALNYGISGNGGTETTLWTLHYGRFTFFDESGYFVEYEKERPLYERKFDNTQTGIIRIDYRSPLGNFVINQNQINSKLFEIYFSKDMSKALYDRLAKGLGKALEFKENVVDNIFIGEGKVNLIDGGDEEKHKGI